MKRNKRGAWARHITLRDYVITMHPDVERDVVEMIADNIALDGREGESWAIRDPEDLHIDSFLREYWKSEYPRKRIHADWKRVARDVYKWLENRATEMAWERVGDVHFYYPQG